MFVKFSAIYLARGNHESKSMNKIYGFEGEVRSKLSETFVELFAEVFCCLPLAHVINQKVFVVHGGLFSVDGVKLSDIRAIDRFCEPPEEGKKCNLFPPLVALLIPKILDLKGGYAVESETQRYTCEIIDFKCNVTRRFCKLFLISSGGL